MAFTNRTFTNRTLPDRNDVVDVPYTCDEAPPMWILGTDDETPPKSTVKIQNQKSPKLWECFDCHKMVPEFISCSENVPMHTAQRDGLVLHTYCSDCHARIQRIEFGP